MWCLMIVLTVQLIWMGLKLSILGVFIRFCELGNIKCI
jgi:hypothetical protein